MLTQLTVKNLAIVTYLELNFANGMHVITGETGAGKSIIIDALSIALGERASTDQIRANESQAEVIACFDISKLPSVQQILKDQDLPNEECVIRRILNSDGRSRAYINGVSVAIQQIKTLAPHLVQIHSQHQHHALLNSEYQRDLLDAYAQHPALVQEVASLYQQWHAIKQQIQALHEAQQHSDRLTLLNYQIQELESLNVQDNEIQLLDQQHSQLARGQELVSTCQMVSTLLSDSSQSDNSSILDQLHTALHNLNNLYKIAPALKPSVELLEQAIIQIQEANNELQIYSTQLDLDPAKLEQIERRLSNIHSLARKLKVTPENLSSHLQTIRAQRDSLTQVNQTLEQLQVELANIEVLYQAAAQKLSVSRMQAADKLTAAITLRVRALEMPNAVFAIQTEELKNSNPSMHGNEAIHFMVSTNPGQALGQLRKIASGGELSRISLAIQVISAQQMATPTLILDEVDVGISGKTAATVGALMRELGANAQIISITHLPQVAAHAHHHYKVEKSQTNEATTTNITPLQATARVQELARLMGGANITPEAIAHAERLLETSI